MMDRSKVGERRGRISLGFVLALLCQLTLCSSIQAQSVWVESWSNSGLGTFVPTCDALTYIRGDRGNWLLGDTASCFEECSPTPQRAEILSTAGNRVLRLKSSGGLGGCAENVWVSLGYPVSALAIPLVAGTKVFVTESGDLPTPKWNGSFPTVDPPSADHVGLWIQDNLGNVVVYLFQRESRYPDHTTNLDVEMADGTRRTVGYHEVFLGPGEGPGGTFARNLYQDFEVAWTVGGNRGTTIAALKLQITAPGTATFDDLRIGEITVPKPVIEREPQSQEIEEDSTLVLTVGAVGAEPLEYQWRRNGNELAFATGPSMMLPTVDSSFSGEFDVVVRNAGGSITSKVATVVVRRVPQPPSIIGQPRNAYATVGAEVYVSVAVTGRAPLFYQWFKGAEAISSGTNASLKFATISTNDAGEYSVTITNRDGMVRSSLAKVQVAAGQPLYDNSLYQDPGERLIDLKGEFGDEIILGDSPKKFVISQLTFLPGVRLFSNTQGTLIIRLYENDGPVDGVGRRAPGTLVFRSVTIGLNGFTTAMTPLTMTQFQAQFYGKSFTWTVEFQGLAAEETAGVALFDPPAVGSSAPDYWRRIDGSWIRVQPVGDEPVGNLGAFVMGAVFDPPSPAPRILDGSVRQKLGAGIEFDVSVATTNTVDIEVSTDLVAWTKLATLPTGNGGVGRFVEEGRVTSGQRFFRCVVPGAP